MALFDTYVAVDWSAKAAPATGADSIWIAVLDAGRSAAGGGSDVVLSNPHTRHTAEATLRSLLEERPGRRTLVGIDVGLGYPVGAADWFGVARAGVPAWRSMWTAITERITDDAHNRNDRFVVAAELNRRGGAAAGPFWGCPHGLAVAGLAPTKPETMPLDAFRATERALRATGRSPKSMWQLTGAGSVGSQSLTAIPVVQRLLDDLPGRVEIWPFTTGFAAPDAAAGQVVVAEIWPTLLDPPYPSGTVRDAAQVAGAARRCAAADASHELVTWFAPDSGADHATAAVSEEGWILGPVG